MGVDKPKLSEQMYSENSAEQISDFLYLRIYT